MRNGVSDFSLANPIYKGASVTFYTVLAGVKTSTKATLYSGLTGSSTLSNPQQLDSDGKFIQAVYVNEPVIASISGLTIGDHDTGIIQAVLSAGSIADVLTSFASSIGSSLIGFIQSGAGTILRTIQDELRETIKITQFTGADTTGLTFSDAAFTSAATKLNAIGGGTFILPKGNYKVWPAAPGATPLMAFTNCDGITIDGSAAIITVAHSWAGSEQGILFQFTDCKKIKFIPPEIISTVQAVNSRHLRGPRVGYFLGNCEVINVPVIKATGALIMLDFYAASAAAETAKSRNIEIGVMHLDRCGYGISCRHSGDDLTAHQVYSDGAHRTYFPYGVRNHEVTIESKNQDADDVNLAAFEGKGLDNITVNYTNIKTTTAQPAAPCVAITYGDQTPAQMNDITINMRVHCPSSGYFGNGFMIQKFDNLGAADTTDRGHTLAGLKFSMVATSDFASWVPFTTSGTWGSGEDWRNIAYRDISITGSGSATANLGSSSDPALFENIDTTSALFVQFAPSTAPANVLNCKATNMTSATSDTGYANYVNCEITDGVAQSATNKNFLNCLVAGRKFNSYAKTGIENPIASKLLNGDLTGTNNIFLVKLAAGLGAYFRLTYALVADQSDTTGTRDETYGIKSFSASMSSSGVWTSHTAQADEVTERTLGTASVITASLVNGSSSGGYIAVSCTNYNSAQARANFRLEVFPIEAYFAALTSHASIEPA